MRIFLDTADLAAVRELARWGCFSGVTTNPLLLARAAVRAAEIVPALAEAIGGELFVQAGDAEEGTRLAQLAPGRVVIKVPVVPSGLEAIRQLAAERIPTAATAVFKAAQALLAARAGALYAIPFWHRIAEAGGDPEREVRDAAGFFERMTPTGQRARVLVASLRTPEQAVAALRAGAYAITVKPELARALLADPGTSAAVEEFARARGEE